MILAMDPENLNLILSGSSSPLSGEGQGEVISITSCGFDSIPNVDSANSFPVYYSNQPAYCIRTHFPNVKC